MLVEYMKRRTVQDLKAKVAEAQRSLDRVNLQAKAKLIQADADRKSKRSIYDQELARKIVRKRDGPAVQELVENLAHKNKGIQNDCIKALYEIGEADPNLIAKYYKHGRKHLKMKTFTFTFLL